MNSSRPKARKAPCWTSAILDESFAVPEVLLVQCAARRYLRSQLAVFFLHRHAEAWEGFSRVESYFRDA